MASIYVLPSAVVALLITDAGETPFLTIASHSLSDNASLFTTPAAGATGGFASFTATLAWTADPDSLASGAFL